MGKGYALTSVYDGCEERHVRTIIPLRQTPRVKQHKPPTCERGVWTFAGADYKRIPRESERFTRLCRRRAAVEREVRPPEAADWLRHAQSP